MKKLYELNYIILNQKQVEEFAYNINVEMINNYVEEHEEEFKVWQDIEVLKDKLKECITKQGKINIEQRRKLLYQLREEQ